MQSQIFPRRAVIVILQTSSELHGRSNEPNLIDLKLKFTNIFFDSKWKSECLHAYPIDKIV